MQETIWNPRNREPCVFPPLRLTFTPRSWFKLGFGSIRASASSWETFKPRFSFHVDALDVWRDAQLRRTIEALVPAWPVQPPPRDTASMTWPLHRALLKPWANRGPLYRCGKSTKKEQSVGYGRRKGGPEIRPKAILRAGLCSRAPTCLRGSCAHSAAARAFAWPPPFK